MRKSEFILITIIFFHLGTLLLRNSNFYTRPYDEKYFAELYSTSQYVKGAGSIGIGDDGLYAFAGNYYITG